VAFIGGVDARNGGKNARKAVRTRGKRRVRARSDVARGVGAPVSFPPRRNRHGVAGASIGLDNALALY
jgi:hypothetical protein